MKENNGHKAGVRPSVRLGRGGSRKKTVTTKKKKTQEKGANLLSETKSLGEQLGEILIKPALRKQPQNLKKADQRL